MHPSWSGHRNSVHEAVENLHSVFAFPWRDYDSSSFLDFFHILFFFFLFPTIISPFLLNLSQTLTIEFNLLLIHQNFYNFDPTIIYRLKNSTHRFLRSPFLLALLEFDLYLPITISFSTCFSLNANFANFTLVQITEKNIERTLSAEDRKSVRAYRKIDPYDTGEGHRLKGRLATDA